MTKRLPSHNPVMEILFTRSLTSQLTRCESLTDRILVGIFGPGPWRLGELKWLGEGLIQKEKQHVVWVLTRWIVEAHPPKWRGRGCLERWLSANSVCLTRLSGKASSMYILSGVNTFIPVEHLTFLTPVPERVRTNCKLMWVVNVSPICFFWGKK